MNKMENIREPSLRQKVDQAVGSVERFAQQEIGELKVFRNTVKTLIVCVLVPAVFLIIGSYVFRHLEYDLEKERMARFHNVSVQLNRTVDEIRVMLNHSTIQVHFEEFITEIRPYLTTKASVPNENIPFWDLTGSAYFSWTIMTTIGYGTYAPFSNAGKAFCIVYTFLSVPVFLVATAVTADMIGKGMLHLFYKFDKQSIFFRLRVLFIWMTGMFFLLILSAAYYNERKDWSYLDSVYFSIITLSTVGLGDFTPKLDEQHVFAFILYCILGMNAVGAMISSLQEAFDSKAEVAAKKIEGISSPLHSPNNKKPGSTWELNDVRVMFEGDDRTASTDIIPRTDEDPKDKVVTQGE